MPAHDILAGFLHVSLGIILGAGTVYILWLRDSNKRLRIVTRADSESNAIVTSTRFVDFDDVAPEKPSFVTVMSSSTSLDVYIISINEKCKLITGWRAGMNASTFFERHCRMTEKLHQRIVTEMYSDALQPPIEVTFFSANGEKLSFVCNSRILFRDALTHETTIQVTLEKCISFPYYEIFPTKNCWTYDYFHNKVQWIITDVNGIIIEVGKSLFDSTDVGIDICSFTETSSTDYNVVMWFKLHFANTLVLMKNLDTNLSPGAKPIPIYKEYVDSTSLGKLFDFLQVGYRKVGMSVFDCSGKPCTSINADFGDIIRNLNYDFVVEENKKIIKQNINYIYGKCFGNYYRIQSQNVTVEDGMVNTIFIFNLSHNSLESSDMDIEEMKTSINYNLERIVSEEESSPKNEEKSSSTPWNSQSSFATREIPWVVKPKCVNIRASNPLINYHVDIEMMFDGSIEMLKMKICEALPEHLSETPPQNIQLAHSINENTHVILKDFLQKTRVRDIIQLNFTNRFRDKCSKTKLYHYNFKPSEEVHKLDFIISDKNLADNESETFSLPSCWLTDPNSCKEDVNMEKIERELHDLEVTQSKRAETRMSSSTSFG